MVMPITLVDTFTTADYINNRIFDTKSALDHGAAFDDEKNADYCHVSPKNLIGEALCQRIEKINLEFCEPGDEDAFFVADLGEVYRQHLRWKLNLPRVKPFYAVKCNPDPQVIRLLASLGTGFDCASKTEIEHVLKMGVDPERIIYAQPCKTNSYVRYVANAGVRKMTFDNTDELRKIARLYPRAELLLRIHTDDSSSLCRLSLKFGATMAITEDLLHTARGLGLKVVGVSFHIGSGALDPGAFLTAVQDAHTVFQQGTACGFDMKILDVGGGFCGDSSFEGMAGALRAALDEYFPAHSGISLMAEPGRFYASTAFTLACNIIARRTVEEDVGGTQQIYMLYVNDGVYGNFSSIMFDHQKPVAHVLRVGGSNRYNTKAAQPVASGGIKYSIWGPTCDGIDRISESICFQQTLDVGDWLYFGDMGAYTKSSATRFNGFSDNHDVIYVCSEPGALAALDVGI